MVPGTVETILALANPTVKVYCRLMADVLDAQVLAELRESVGDDQEFFAELVDELLEDGPRQLDALRTAATGGDAQAARRVAHTLKGNGRTFGASAFSALCYEAEAAAASDELDVVVSRLDAIDDAWTQVAAALAAERDGAS